MINTMKTKFKAKGFSLIEIMVGLTVGLIGMVVVMHVMSVSDANKRVATGGSDSLQNGALALYNIERDIRIAGYGVNEPGYMGCDLDAQVMDNGTQRNIDFFTSPLIITQGATNPDGSETSDTITVFYGNPKNTTSGHPLAAGTTTLTEDYLIPVGRRYAFPDEAKGELILVVEPAPNLRCSLAQITGVNLTTDNYALEHAAASAGNKNSWFNSSTRGNATFTGAARVYKLGHEPRHVSYTINNNRLTSTDILYSSIANEIVADDIVNLQAQYGVDINNNGALEDTEWTTTAPAQLEQILAARLGLVARHAKRDPDCNSTTVRPTWSGGTFDLSNNNASTEWQCYFYTVLETTVPLRSMIWRPQ